jgi:hypothetical protein
MNKIHAATLFLWGIIFTEWDEKYPLIDSIEYIEFDKWLEITYGILRLNTNSTVRIIDQSKFTLLMLKYSDCIEKISYE